MNRRTAVAAALLGCWFLCANGRSQEAESRQKIRAFKEWAKDGSTAIPKIQPYLIDADPEVRREAVKYIAAAGTQRSLDPLLGALKDSDGQVQVCAADGIVNFYFPGYMEESLCSQLKRAGAGVPSGLRSESEQVVEADISVRPEIVGALGKQAEGGASMGVRANAVRALGILRGRQALPEITRCLKTKDDGLIFESLIAIQKFRDPQAGESVVFLVRDLDPKIQAAAIETVGLLRTKEALPALKRVLEGEPEKKIRRATWLALARIADPSYRDMMSAGLNERDEEIRAAAAEGLGRISDKRDWDTMHRAYELENSRAARLSQAFALAAMGRTDLSELAPLRYLVDTLNQRVWRGVSLAYLMELAQKPESRASIIRALSTPAATREEKTGLAAALGASGASDAVKPLELLTKDEDAEVSRDALRALGVLRAGSQK
jgi:HEAT repeat protein